MPSPGQSTAEPIFSPTSDPRPAPLVVAITGHRDLIAEQTPALKASLEKVLDELASQSPHSPRVFLTQLAEGADQIGAKVAQSKGYQICATIPMPLRMFREDFVEREAREKFEKCLAAADRVIEFPVPSQFTEAQASVHGPARNACYAATGAWCVAHAHVLIAVWDGKVEAGHGGTGEVVRTMLEGPVLDYHPDRGPLDLARLGPVIRIVAGRQRDQSAADPIGEIQYRFPASGGLSSKSAFAGFIKHLDRMNGYILETSPPISELRPDRVAACDLRAKSLDHAAARMKRISGWIFQATTLLGLFAVTFRQLDSNSATAHDYFYFWCAVCFLGALVLFLFMQKYQWHGRFLDYRSLAEALRVQRVWMLVGIKASTADGYLRSQRRELSWLRAVLQAWELTDYSLPKVDSIDPMERIRGVRRDWIDDQINFFAKRMDQRRGQIDRFKTAELSLVVLGLVQMVSALIIRWHMSSHIIPRRTEHWSPGILGMICAIIYAIGATAFGFGIKRMTSEPVAIHAQHDNRPKHGSAIFAFIFAGIAMCAAWMIVWPAGYLDLLIFRVSSETLATLAPITAAAIYAFRRHYAYVEELRLYARMHLMFQTASDALPGLINVNNASQARELIYSLGRESLAENGDWLLTHRERPVQLPKP